MGLMKNRMKVFTKSLMLLFISTFTLSSQVTDFQKGLEAFNSKNYERALNYLKPYADDSSNCLAQYIVGYCFADSNTQSSNDSLAEYYLLQSSEQKYGRAMGLLAVKYFAKASTDTNSIINALVWAELAAYYDPIQSLNSSRYLIREYLSPESIEKAEAIIRKKKKILDEIDICM